MVSCHEISRNLPQREAAGWPSWKGECLHEDSVGMPVGTQHTKEWDSVLKDVSLLLRSTDLGIKKWE